MTAVPLPPPPVTDPRVLAYADGLAESEGVVLLDEDPVTCPSCGARTEWDDLASGPNPRQLHTCLNAVCGRQFVTEFDAEAQDSHGLAVAMLATSAEQAARIERAARDLAATLTEAGWHVLAGSAEEIAEFARLHPHLVHPSAPVPPSVDSRPCTLAGEHFGSSRHARAESPS